MLGCCGIASWGRFAVRAIGDLPFYLLLASWMILDRQPDTICLCIVLMPWIDKCAVVFNVTEGKGSRIPRTHGDLFIQCGIILSFKLLHPAMTKNLRMDLDKVMFVVDKTMGLRGGKPHSAVWKPLFWISMIAVFACFIRKGGIREGMKNHCSC